MNAPSEPFDCPGSLHVIVRREKGWPDGSDTLLSLASELKETNANVHLCIADEGTPPRSNLNVTVHRRRSDERTGAILNRALAAETTSHTLILDTTDVLMRHSLVRMLGAFRDPNYDVCYGMVIDSTGDLISALPLEGSRLEHRNYIAAASLWRRSVLESLGGWSEAHASEPELPWELWRRLSRSQFRTYFIARPLVRQRFLQ